LKLLFLSQKQKQNKKHSIGEDCFTSSVQICESVQSLEVAEPLKKMPVSNNTNERRID
jgi:hypothetical protein